MSRSNVPAVSRTSTAAYIASGGSIRPLRRTNDRVRGCPTPYPRTVALRVSAYAVIIGERGMLLSRLSPLVGVGPLWTLPGGGIDPFEDPVDAAVREVREETGYDVAIDNLVGVSSLVIDPALEPTNLAEKTQMLRIVYRAHVVGGALTHEVDGSTDLAGWIALAELDDLPRVELVDVARTLAGLTPPST